MKLVNFYQVERSRIGILDEKKDKIYPISEVLNKDEEMSIYELIEEWDEEFYTKLKNYSTIEGIPLKDVKLSAPIPQPSRVMCVGKNYVDHVKEVDSTMLNTATGIPDNLIFFTKNVNRAVGPNEAISSHETLTDSLDYEVELAIVIGKEGSNISKEDAKDYIFGFTILNDISVRNIQTKHVQWFKGKSLDNTCPIGPVILTTDEVKFPLNLIIQSRINGELRQNSTTDKMIWGVEEIIEELSKGMTLKKGDIIATGTPSGVGMGFNPKKFLKKDDIVECFIEKIGTLRNTVK